MSAEWVTAIATAGTFLVIAASATAALMQIRHMRSSNQIAAVSEFREALESPEFSDILNFAIWEVPHRLSDPSAREAMLARDWSGVPPEFRRLSKIANLFEYMGLLVKNKIIEADLVCDMWGYTVRRCWNALGPIIANRRAMLGNPAINENFEYLAALSDRWLERRPSGAYPANMARMPQTDLWPEMERKIVQR
jgi:hypothetical protein